MSKKAVRCEKCNLVLSKRQRDLKVDLCSGCQEKEKSVLNEEQETVDDVQKEASDDDEESVEEDKMETDEGLMLSDDEMDMVDSLFDTEEKYGTETDYEPGTLETRFPLKETDINDADYLTSIPDGWKVVEVEVGFGTIIKRFVDTVRNKKYISRIEAIRSVSKEGEGRKEEVETLKKGLALDGWLTSPLLPQGWYSKPMLKNKSRFKFFTDKHEWINGLGKVIRMMNESENFTKQDQENLLNFIREFQAFNRVFEGNTEDNLNGWMDGDDYLPPGWRFKTTSHIKGDIVKVMSPNGEVFANKCKAIAFLVGKNRDPEVVTKMRESLIYDGWLESVHLPPDWRYRRCKSDRNEHNFLSPEGELLPSRITLIAFMRTYKKYTEDDISNLAMLSAQLKAKWVSERQPWILDDKSVPEGWKIRYFNGVKANGKPRKRCYISSPEGKVFQSRAKALKWMIETNRHADQIAYMRDQMSSEGWETHERLPEGWNIKYLRKDGVEGKAGFLFFTSEGKILSLKSALVHMDLIPDKYTADNIFEVNTLAKTFSQISTSLKVEWNDCDSVPEGWKTREVPVKGNFPLEYFLAPDGSQLTGRVTALKYLLKLGYQLFSPEIERMKAELSRNGWEEDLELLPKGWLKRKVRKTENIACLTPDFREHKNLTLAFHFMRANNYSLDDLKKIRKHLDLNSQLSHKRKGITEINAKTYKWGKSENIPPGWKIAYKTYKYDPTKTLYLSPNGIFLQNSALALQLMLEEELNENVLTYMFTKLESEGWVTDRDLPEGWRLNTDKKKFPDNILEDTDESPEVMFLTDQVEFLTPGIALQQITSSKELSREEQERFLDLMLGLKSRGWIDDHTLPPGWKVKKEGMSFKTNIPIMSPDQKEFDSCLSTFLFLVEENRLEEEELEMFRMKLLEEGWEQSDKLPARWLVARNRGDSLFELLSREGVLYQTLDQAQEFMEGREGEYSDLDRLGVEEVCMDQVEAHLANKLATNPSFNKTVNGFMRQKRERRSPDKPVSKEIRKEKHKLTYRGNSIK